MEKVFVLMWLADIAGSISAIGIIAAIILGLTLFMFGVYSALEGDPEKLVIWLKASKWLWPIVFCAAIVPGQKTIQLMAIASASEVAVSTELGAKGIEALSAVLDRVIGESSGKTKK